MRALAAKPEVGNDFRLFHLVLEIAGAAGRESGIRKTCSCDGGARRALHFLHRVHKGSGAKAENSQNLFV